MQRETLRTLPLKNLRSTEQLVHSDGLLSLAVVYGRKRVELTTKQGGKGSCCRRETRRAGAFATLWCWDFQGVLRKISVAQVGLNPKLARNLAAPLCFALKRGVRDGLATGIRSQSLVRCGPSGAAAVNYVGDDQRPPRSESRTFMEVV